VFRIAGTRSSQVLWDMLGREFKGVLGCDYFSAYRKYMKDDSVLVQFCLAHLIRDLKFLTTLPDPATAAYGQDILDALRELFHVFHQRETMSESAFLAALADRREAVMAAALVDAPDTREAQNLADRFRLHGNAYFQFISAPCKGVGLQRVRIPPGNWVAPAGSYRSGGGGNKAVGAFEKRVA